LDSNDGIAVRQRILFSGVGTFLVDDDDVVCEVDTSQQQVIQAATSSRTQSLSGVAEEESK